MGRHEEGQEVQRTNKDYLSSLKSLFEERTWGKNVCLVKVNKDNLWCIYCKKPRHTKENCRKLNSKPPSQEWGNRGGQQRP